MMTNVSNGDKGIKWRQRYQMGIAHVCLLDQTILEYTTHTQ